MELQLNLFYVYDFQFLKNCESYIDWLKIAIKCLFDKSGYDLIQNRILKVRYQSSIVIKCSDIYGLSDSQSQTSDQSDLKLNGSEKSKSKSKESNKYNETLILIDEIDNKKSIPKNIHKKMNDFHLNDLSQFKNVKIQYLRFKITLQLMDLIFSNFFQYWMSSLIPSVFTSTNSSKRLATC